jgi:hypothetical protein
LTQVHCRNSQHYTRNQLPKSTTEIDGNSSMLHPMDTQLLANKAPRAYSICWAPSVGCSGQQHCKATLS